MCPSRLEERLVRLLRRCTRQPSELLLDGLQPLVEEVLSPAVAVLRALAQVPRSVVSTLQLDGCATLGESLGNLLRLDSRLQQVRLSANSLAQFDPSEVERAWRERHGSAARIIKDTLTGGIIFQRD